MAFRMRKRSILGLVAGAIMTLGVAAPALAVDEPLNQSNTVSVSGLNQASLAFSITSGDSINFGNLDPAVPCVTRSGSQFLIKSNLPYTGTVKASTNSDNNTSGVGVSQLHYSSTGAAACVPSSAFSGGADAWTVGLATSGATVTTTYALDVLYSNTPGNVDISLLYKVTQ